MNIWQKTSGLIKGFKAIYLKKNRERTYLREMNNIAQRAFLEQTTKDNFHRQFKELQLLEKLTTFEQKQKLPPYFQNKKEKILEKYTAKDYLGVMCEACIPFNELYNAHRPTIEGKWINLRTQFLEYQFEKQQTLKKHADETKQQEWLNEEKQLIEKITSLIPDKRKKDSEALLEKEIEKLAEEIKGKVTLSWQRKKIPVPRITTADEIVQESRRQATLKKRQSISEPIR
jgi:hypothetical protein